MNKEKIREILKDIDKKEYSHVLICLDTWDYRNFMKYVKREDDIDQFIENFWKEHKGGMFRIEEVYNLDLDIESQLSEYRSNHREKSKREILKKYPELESISEIALNYATLKHKGQYRKGNNPKEYIIHPINVANLVKKYKESHNIESLVAAAYLHDTLEDTDTTYYDLVKKFGFEIASLVMEVTTDKDLKNEIGKTKYLCIKMKNMSNWALVIKLCDRLDNISSLIDVDLEFRKKYIEETLFIMNFLINNRKLTKTHLSIIRDTVKLLHTIIMYNYADDDKEMIDVNNLILKIYEKEVSNC